jgi:hypothetical protein
MSSAFKYHAVLWLSLAAETALAVTFGSQTLSNVLERRGRLSHALIAQEGAQKEITEITLQFAPRLIEVSGRLARWVEDGAIGREVADLYIASTALRLMSQAFPKFRAAFYQRYDVPVGLASASCWNLIVSHFTKRPRSASGRDARAAIADREALAATWQIPAQAQGAGYPVPSILDRIVPFPTLDGRKLTPQQKAHYYKDYAQVLRLLAPLVIFHDALEERRDRDSSFAHLRAGMLMSRLYCDFKGAFPFLSGDTYHGELVGQEINDIPLASGPLNTLGEVEVAIRVQLPSDFHVLHDHLLSYIRTTEVYQLNSGSLFWRILLTIDAIHNNCEIFSPKKTCDSN